MNFACPFLQISSKTLVVQSCPLPIFSWHFCLAFQLFGRLFQSDFRWFSELRHSAIFQSGASVGHFIRNQSDLESVPWLGVPIVQSALPVGLPVFSQLFQSACSFGIGPPVVGVGRNWVAIVPHIKTLGSNSPYLGLNCTGTGWRAA